MAENRSGMSLDIILQVSELRFLIFCRKSEKNSKKLKKTYFFTIFGFLWDLIYFPSELDRASRSSLEAIICLKMVYFGVLDVL